MTRRPTYQFIDGVLDGKFPMPSGFPADGLRSGIQYKAQTGDIFVASYPKCGTTWVQNIVYLICHNGHPLPADQSLTTVFPHLEEVGSDAISQLEPPRLIKTHLPFEITPFSPAARYIYVARNPFDCAISFYHHTRGFVQHYDFADGTFSEFFECFVTGQVDFGDYFDNLLGWYGQRDLANVCFLSFEALKEDCSREVRRIGEFIGGRGTLAVHDSDILARIVDASSFSSMRRDQQRWSSTRPDGMPEFVRKGQVGDWINAFSNEQTARLLERIRSKAPGGELDALWPQVLDAARADAGGSDGP